MSGEDPIVVFMTASNGEEATRLEAIRRVTPSEYAINVKAICEYAREARDAALNSFYGDTVIKDSAQLEKNPNGGDSPSSEAKKQ